MCDECNQAIHEKSEVGSDGALMCEKCAALRLERKEAIHEVVDTEISYGKDLKIIKEVQCSSLENPTLQLFINGFLKSLKFWRVRDHQN